MISAGSYRSFFRRERKEERRGERREKGGEIFGRCRVKTSFSYTEFWRLVGLVALQLELSVGVLNIMSEP